MRARFLSMRGTTQSGAGSGLKVSAAGGQAVGRAPNTSRMIRSASALDAGRAEAGSAASAIIFFRSPDGAADLKPQEELIEYV